VTRDGRYVTTLRPSDGWYPTQGILPGQDVTDLVGGEPVSIVSLNSTPIRDLWAAITPPEAQLPEASLIAQADTLIPTRLSGTDQLVLAYRLLSAIEIHYVNNPPPIVVTLLASPLVMWIWVGGLIVLLGGLTAIWPPPSALRRRVQTHSAAPVSRPRGREREPEPVA
jgi:hypothetical protein